VASRSFLEGKGARIAEREEGEGGADGESRTERGRERRFSTASASALLHYAERPE